MSKRPRQATLDSLFSKVIRERDDYTCRICQKNFRHDPGFLDCAHHVSRRRGAVRWDEDNACALCRKCHNQIDQHPLDHAEFIKAELGEERYEALRERARGLMKMTDSDRRDLAKSLNDKLKEYKARRAAGETGRLCS